MDDREKKEEKNKRVGMLVSVGVQLVLLILFYFLIAWKAPFPPIPEYGIELGFTSSAGASQSSPSPNTVEENQPESQAQPEQESNDETPVENEQAEDQTETAEVDESDTVVETEEASSDEPEVAEEVIQEVEEVVQSENETVDKPIESEEESDVEVEEEPTIDDRAIYGNQGTDTGNEEGASLALAGWIWDFKPKPDDTSDETGKIVYQIVVDEDGYLVKIETLTSTVSPSVERKYREAVEKLTFSKTSDYKPAPLSNGTLTFIIKSR